MNKKKLYILMGEIALEYRLSLSNICILLDIENTEQNRMEIYNTIISQFDYNNFSIAQMYKYLFNYETSIESEEASKNSLNKSAKFLGKYSYLLSKGDKEKCKELLSSLNNTEKELVSLKSKGISSPLTLEDTMIISKYRIKHRLSRMSISDILGINRNVLAKQENRLEDKILKEKIQKNVEFFEDITKKNYRR